MKKIYLFIALFACALCSCGSDEDGMTYAQPVEIGETTDMKTAKEVAEALWATTPLQQQPLNAERAEVLKKIQKMADDCTSDFFEGYIASLDQSAEMREKYDPMLAFYRLSLDHVINAIKTTTVENGTTCIWQLYNMGYIIKTPTTCFGIDINHRWAEKLEPYLDFLCVTHKHQDHYNTALINAMLNAGKPVYSNWIKGGYTSKVNTDYQFNNIKIHVSITDHNNSGLSNFVSVFTFECGDDSGNFTMLHTGDSNFKAAQYTNILPHVNVLIPRYAPNALTENNIIGTGAGQTKPDYVLLSHILELSHESEEESRWSLNSALERASKLNCENSFVPFWGEKLVWKDGKLN